MERLGEGLWEAGVAAGHTILLYGDLGTGKTTLARGLIQAATAGGKEEVAVTSPSYLLDNSYTAVDEETGETFTIHHMDLYRLSKGEQDLKILGFPDVLKEALCLIEWPQLLLQQQNTHTNIYTPLPRIDIHLEALDEDTRTCTLTAVGGGWAEEVVKRLEEILKEEGKGGEWNE